MKGDAVQIALVCQCVQPGTWPSVDNVAANIDMVVVRLVVCKLLALFLKSRSEGTLNDIGQAQVHNGWLEMQSLAIVPRRRLCVYMDGG